MKHKNKILMLAVALLIALGTFKASAILTPVHAATCTAPGDSNQSSDQICNPIAVNTAPELIVKAIEFLLGLIGVLAVLFIIIGGFQIVTSAGNEETAKKGRRTLTYAVIGLAVAILAYAIVIITHNTLTGLGGAGSATTTGSSALPGGSGGGSGGTGGTTTSGTTGGTPVQGCSTQGQSVDVSITPQTVELGGTITLTPHIQGGIPAGCSNYTIRATARSGTLSQSFGSLGISDGQSDILTISGSNFTSNQPSTVFTVTVNYIDTTTNSGTIFASGSSTFTVTQTQSTQKTNPGP